MNGLAIKQLFELGIMIASALIYVVLHYACNGIAIAISGQKTGIIRGFLQGIILCGVFAVAEIFVLNGAIKWYHIVLYIGGVFIVIKGINFVKKSIAKKRKSKQKEF